jgi:hypothetical protein
LLVRLPPVAGSDPGFQVWGGAIQNIVFGVIRVKNHDFRQKTIFFPNLGGGGVTTVWWISPGTPDFSIHTTDCHNIAKILLKMALCTHTLI